MQTIEIPLSQLRRITSKPFEFFRVDEQKRIVSILLRVNGDENKATELERNSKQFNFAIVDDISPLTFQRAS
jgi:hypothetical protein